MGSDRVDNQASISCVGDVMSWKNFDSGWSNDYNFEQKTETATETKNANPHSANRSFVQFLQDNDNWQLSFAILIEYSKRCSPFGNSIAIISEALADIPLHVKDIKTGDFVENHDAVEFLKYPNNDQSYEDFITQLAGMYLITGSPLVTTFGSTTRPPSSIDILNPKDADPQPDQTGALGSIRLNSEFNNKNYIAKFDKGRTRYRAGNDNEIWPVFAFNPDRGSRKFWGTPTAQPLYYEIEQYINAGMHNKTMLKRGARPGGLFSIETETPLTDEQRKQLQDAVDVYYAGPSNAGRPMVAHNIKFQEHIVSNRDMDYKSLVDNASDSIYRQFKIPLPMVSNKANTYSNYETSLVALYDRAVLPLAKFLYRQLTMAIMYRFTQDWKRYEFAYDEGDIGALQIRRNEAVKLEKDIAVSTVNELRQEIGREPLPDGDVILRSSTDVPALDGYDDVVDTKLDGMSEDEKRFQLEKVMNIDGTQKYTPEQIDAIVSR